MNAKRPTADEINKAILTLSTARNKELKEYVAEWRAEYDNAEGLWNIESKLEKFCGRFRSCIANEFGYATSWRKIRGKDA